MLPRDLVVEVPHFALSLPRLEIGRGRRAIVDEQAGLQGTRLVVGFVVQPVELAGISFGSIPWTPTAASEFESAKGQPVRSAAVGHQFLHLAVVFLPHRLRAFQIKIREEIPGILPIERGIIEPRPHSSLMGGIRELLDEVLFCRGVHRIERIVLAVKEGEPVMVLCDHDHVFHAGAPGSIHPILGGKFRGGKLVCEFPIFLQALFLVPEIPSPPPEMEYNP